MWVQCSQNLIPWDRGRRIRKRLLFRTKVVDQIFHLAFIDVEFWSSPESNFVWKSRVFGSFESCRMKASRVAACFLLSLFIWFLWGSLCQQRNGPAVLRMADPAFLVVPIVAFDGVSGYFLQYCGSIPLFLVWLLLHYCRIFWLMKASLVFNASFIRCNPVDIFSEMVVRDTFSSRVTCFAWFM